MAAPVFPSTLYTKAIRATLLAALCVRNFASPVVAGRSHPPEVERRSDSDHLLLAPLIIARSDSERCLIESSINSVRVSFLLKQRDEREKVIVERFCRFLQTRAELFSVVGLRRRAVPGYSLSFLLTHSHCEEVVPLALVEALLAVTEGVAHEVAELDFGVSARASAVAQALWKQFE